MIVFADFLPSKFFEILIKGHKTYTVWCQERDSNPRPPAYESEETPLDKTKFVSKKVTEYYQTKTYKQLKVDIYYKGTAEKQTKNKKNRKALNLDFTLLSLRKGLISDYICRVFADLKRSVDARLFSFTKSQFTRVPTQKIQRLSLIVICCLHIKSLDGCSCKLISKRKLL